MKIQKIEVTNLKAVSSQTADFNGCSAIITAGNRKGKSTMLKSLIDRFHSEKPEIIVKEGEEKGNYTMWLTDGSCIEWNFTEKSESFAFITSDGIKMTTGVLKAIGEKYFGIPFDIDKFLLSTPKEQSKQVCKLLGLDFSEIDSRYKIAYEERTEANREVQRLRSIAKIKPEQVEKPNIEALKKEKTAIEIENSALREQWKIDNQKHQLSIIEYNKANDYSRKKNEEINSDFDTLSKLSLGYLSQFIDIEKAGDFVNSLPETPDDRPITSLPEPGYKSLIEIEKKIEDANEQQRKFDNYERDLKEYDDWVKEGTAAATKAKECDEKVKSIEAEKASMIQSANVPAEFKFTEDGITYNGFPLSNNQIASSEKYVAALKLGAMSLGMVKTLHFDASFLDKNSLADVEAWANENDLQLLIERPDFDGGEITYQII